MIHINLPEAKAQLSHLLELAHNGEQVIICKYDVPFAQITSIPNQITQPKKKRELGLARNHIIFIADDAFDPMTDEEIEEIENNTDDPLNNI